MVNSSHDLIKTVQSIVVSNYYNSFVTDPVMQEGYLTEAQQYAQETELSRRVRDWEDRIVPVLAQEVNRFFIKKNTY